ncbi:adhesion g-protein coupled receptor [Anaeramoeba ignava]|uniref:Adhesion g-protein coupled receptor n=1 Tax=Anaeramoeba ignava TaxID=1746090 RepID=A0A9Q0LR58_ANAIG|nr:adhesion g-protein coupled receptor [Anaeramoeba ignava]
MLRVILLLSVLITLGFSTDCPTCLSLEYGGQGWCCNDTIQVCVNGTYLGPTTDTCDYWFYNECPDFTVDSLKFTDDGKLMVIFSGETNKYNSTDCSDFIQEPDLYRGGYGFNLGTSSVCTWKDAKTLEVELGYDSDFTVGTAIGFTTNIRLTTYTWLNLSGKSFTIEAADNPEQAVPVFWAETLGNTCENLYLDATGSTGAVGRKFKNVVWSLSSDCSSTANIDTILDIASSQGDLLVDIPYSELETDCYYNFTLELANFIMENNQSTGFSLNIPSTPAISVGIAGSLRVKRGDTLILQAIVSNCGNSGSYSYQWTMAGVDISGVDTFPELRFNTTGLNLASYDVTVQVSGSTTSTVTVFIEDPVPIAVMTPQFVTIHASDSLTIDGSDSSDPAGMPMTYKWTCEDDQGNPCQLMTLTNSYLTLPANLLSLGRYYISLVVTTNDSRESLTVFGFVQVVDDSQANGIIKMMSYPADASNTLTLMARFDGQFISDIENHFTLTWVSVDGKYDFSGNGVTKTEGGIVFPANTFNASETYEFRLDFSTTSSGYDIMGSIPIKFTTAPPAVGGICSGAPASGDSFSTNFTFICENWVAPMGQELNYIFYIKDGEKMIPLSNLLTQSSFRTFVPPGVEKVYAGILTADSMVEVEINANSTETQASPDDFILDFIDNDMSVSITNSDFGAARMKLLLAVGFADQYELNETVYEKLLDNYNKTVSGIIDVTCKEEMRALAYILNKLLKNTTTLTATAKTTAIDAANYLQELGNEMKDEIDMGLFDTLQQILAIVQEFDTSSIIQSLSGFLQSMAKISGNSAQIFSSTTYQSSNTSITTYATSFTTYSGITLMNQLEISTSLFPAIAYKLGSCDTFMISIVDFGINPFAAESSLQLYTGVKQVTFWDCNGNAMDFKDLNNVFGIYIPKKGEFNSSEYQYNCMSWEESSSMWSSDGCFLTDPGNANVLCSCNHMSNFAANNSVKTIINGTSPQPPATDSGSSTNAGAIAGGIIGGLAGAALIVGGVFYIKRRKSNEDVKVEDILPSTKTNIKWRKGQTDYQMKHLSMSSIYGSRSSLAPNKTAQTTTQQAKPQKTANSRYYDDNIIDDLDI